MTTPARNDVDWRKLHERLDRARAEADRWLTPDPDRSRRILDERARALAARVAPGEGAAEESLHLIFFRAGGELFAVELAWTISVTHIGIIEPVPDAPSVFRGVVSHRGKLLVIVDLGAVLKGTPSETSSSRALVLGGDRPEIGITVDEVDDVVRVPLSRIERSAMSPWNHRAAFASGVIDGRRLVIDGKLLLEDPRLTAARSDL